jgi:exonuclease VII small subunit
METNPLEQEDGGSERLPSGGGSERSDGVTRRQFIGGAAAAGAALVGSNVTTAFLASAWGKGTGEARARQDAQAEIERLRGLVRLYEKLEQVGIDTIIAAGMSAVDLLLDGLKSGAKLLESAVRLIEDAIAALEKSLPTLQDGAKLVGDLLDAARTKVDQLSALLSEMSGKARPLTDALGAFLRWLIGNIPFGVGQKVLEANDQIAVLIGGLPDLFNSITTKLLDPLRNDWLSTEAGKGIGGSLLKPLRERLLSPLRTYLHDVAHLADEWEAKLLKPARAALNQRETIRQEIERYKAVNGL